MERFLDGGIAALAGGLLGSSAEPLPLAAGLAAVTLARMAARHTSWRPGPRPSAQTATEFETALDAPGAPEEQHLAVIDALTGLPNRRALERVLGAACAPQSSSGAVGVVVCGLREVDLVRRRVGVEASRELLRQTGKRLRSGVAQAGLVGRWGGAEFLVIVPGATRTTLPLFAERLRRLLEAEPVDVGAAPRLTVRVGVGWACAPHDGVTAVQLVACARVHAAAPEPRNLTLAS